MPITASAREKMHQDKRRRTRNLLVAGRLKTGISKAKNTPTPENLRKAISLIDQSVKKGLTHKNKAARLKARLPKNSNNEKSSKVSSKIKKGRTKKTLKPLNNK